MKSKLIALLMVSSMLVPALSMAATTATSTDAGMAKHQKMAKPTKKHFWNKHKTDTATSTSEVMPKPMKGHKADKMKDTSATTGATKVSDTDPAGATAVCNDGTYSHSAHHDGSCSRHQGVKNFLN